MFRMGKKEMHDGELPHDAPPAFAPNYPPTASYAGNPAAAQSALAPNAGRAFTESEAVARDIKEGNLSGYVGSGTSLTGEVSFKSMLHIDGHLTGRITSETGTLTVGTSGQVDANIDVAIAIIKGAVNGDIIATERLEMGRAAKVFGNVEAPKLVIEDGAVFEGNCLMVKAKEAMEKRHAAPAKFAEERQKEAVAAAPPKPTAPPPPVAPPPAAEPQAAEKSA